MSDGADPEAPVVTVDGPSGTGKGTLSALLAQEVGWHYLDSGALYRAVALAARERGVALAAEAAEELGRVARHLAVHFEPMPEGPVRAFVDDQDVTDELRSGPVSEGASVVAALVPVREGLLALQQASRRQPGLVADGRDMGTEVFPDAPAKLFLSATPDERARRRYEQLREQGGDVNLDKIRQELKQRDDRDAQRDVAPLRPADDAYVIDTTDISVEEVLAEAMNWLRQRYPKRFDQSL